MGEASGVGFLELWVSFSYWLLVGNMGIRYYRDYIGIIFPYTLLRTSKFGVA